MLCKIVFSCVVWSCVELCCVVLSCVELLWVMLTAAELCWVVPSCLFESYVELCWGALSYISLDGGQALSDVMGMI